VLRERRLDHTAFPYVFLDATYVKARVNHQVVSRAVVIATGVTAEGNREVLGVDVGDSEDELFWTTFLRTLKDRGLGGVQLVISDAHAGLKASIARVLQGAAWQRCRVHLMRIDGPSGVGRCATCAQPWLWSRRRWSSRVVMTRSWRAVSSVQPRSCASSRSTRTSASWACRMGANSGVGT
jgi:hypothetical protein